MKRISMILPAFAIVAFIACNNEKTNDAVAEVKANVPADMHGFTPAYSASFVMDDAKNTETVLALWNEWKSGDLSGSRNHFADSITFYLSDGSDMSGKTEDMLKNMQDYRSSFKAMELSVDAVFAVKSTDKNENWVTIWGTEIQTDANGKADSLSRQETWRFNKNGKVDLMFQADRKGIIPPPPATN